MKRLFAVTVSLIALCAVYGDWTQATPQDGTIEFVTLTPENDPANPYNRFPPEELRVPASADAEARAATAR